MSGSNYYHGVLKGSIVKIIKFLSLVSVVALISACGEPAGSRGEVSSNGSVSTSTYLGTLPNGCTLHKYRWYETAADHSASALGQYLLCPGMATSNISIPGKTATYQSTVMTTEEYEKKVMDRIVGKLSEEELAIIQRTR